MSLFKVFLFLHIICGGTGLLLGSIILSLKKGNKVHKLLGKIFSVAMLVAGITSLILASMHPNKFLFAVGVFTIYMVATGWSYMYLKNIAKGQKVFLFNWLILIASVICSFWFLYIGISSLIKSNTFGIVLIVFGLICLLMAWQDYKIYNGKLKYKNYWLVMHIQRMVGAYIASCTAFAVVNAPEKLSIVAWLLPGCILTPLLIKWGRKYEIPLK
jgi:uncharacterized membrane protein